MFPVGPKILHPPFAYQPLRPKIVLCSCSYLSWSKVNKIPFLSDGICPLSARPTHRPFIPGIRRAPTCLIFVSIFFCFLGGFFLFLWAIFFIFYFFYLFNFWSSFSWVAKKGFCVRYSGRPGGGKKIYHLFLFYTCFFKNFKRNSLVWSSVICKV